MLEMILSISILFIIFAMFSGFSEDIKQKIYYFSAKKVEYTEKSRTYAVIFNDIFLSDTIFVQSNPTFDILILTTKNSLYGIARPSVMWYVLKDGRKLIRVESKDELNIPLRRDMIRFYHADIFESGVSSFRALKSNNEYFVSIGKQDKSIMLAVSHH